MMSKIYECGFTASGIVQTDTIGGVDLTLDASCIYQDPLTGFINRPGWFLDNASTISTSNSRVLYFDDTSRNTKSIVFWFRITSGDGSGNLYAGGTGFSRDGLYGTGGSSGLQYRDNGVGVGSILSQAAYINNEWHMVVISIDRINIETDFYADGVFLGTWSGITASSPSMSLGTPNCEVGLIQVYDTLLNVTEVENLWNTGLIDSPVQQPLLTLQGTVYDFNNLTVSGADVVVFNHDNKLIDSVYTTASGGNYVAYFPTVGKYSLSVSKEEVIGGRVIPITVTSGGYTTYDS